MYFQLESVADSLNRENAQESRSMREFQSHPCRLNVRIFASREIWRYFSFSCVTPVQ